MAPGRMRAGSEGVYGTVGVPPGEILFHLSAQPECCVLLRSGGRHPPHKAGSVSGSSKATAIKHAAGRRGVPRNRYDASAVSKRSPWALNFQSNFPRSQKIVAGFGSIQVWRRLPGKQRERFQVSAQDVFPESGVSRRFKVHLFGDTSPAALCGVLLSAFGDAFVQ